MKPFFVGRNVPGNPTHKWWSKAKLDIEKQILMRQVEEGEQSDHNCTAVHLPHLRRMLIAFARVDKWDAVMNRAILHTAWCTWSTIGAWHLTWRPCGDHCRKRRPCLPLCAAHTPAL